jgi:REP element-mobilizing transposase RayT
MVLAYHIIFTAYGFWLPNDPRGSWSEFVRAWELFWFGPATKTDDRHSLARRPHDRSLRLATKSALKYEPVKFTEQQILHISKGFANAVAESAYRLLACAILPSHVHLVLDRHERLAERVAGHLKARATQALVEADLHPFEKFRGEDGRFPSVWAHRSWKVFLNDAEAIDRAIRYVENNPVKERLPRQTWPFVQREEQAGDGQGVSV